jgi:hypothetical protein
MLLNNTYKQYKPFILNINNPDITQNTYENIRR